MHFALVLLRLSRVGLTPGFNDLHCSHPLHIFDLHFAGHGFLSETQRGWHIFVELAVAAGTVLGAAGAAVVAFGGA
jgi:hypothetical protein